MAKFSPIAAPLSKVGNQVGVVSGTFGRGMEPHEFSTQEIARRRAAHCSSECDIPASHKGGEGLGERQCYGNLGGDQSCSDGVTVQYGVWQRSRQIRPHR